MTKGNTLKEVDGIDDTIATIARSNALREADDIDANIVTMLAGKSLQEAEELYAGWKAMLSPLFKKMVDQGYTPQKVKSDIENKRIPGLTDEGAAAIGQLFPVYWKSVYGSKKLR
ncbi:hypothetical protein PC112_g16634 [Phytophthora cactorum]|nr:hypothetical protein PC112_g16634 [Phytophthora cactorum]